MRIDGSRRLKQVAAWLVLVLVPVPGCGGVTTGGSAGVDPSREAGAGSEADGAPLTADARAPSPVDCTTLSAEVCRATPSCLPILASRYDTFSNCLDPPEAVACTTANTTCAARVTVARSDTGECRVFTSTCVAPGWSPVADPTAGCISAVGMNAPTCKEIFGPCPADPCPVIVMRPESVGDGGAGPSSCRFRVPPPPSGRTVPLNLTNVYLLTTSEPQPVPYVVDPARCDPTSGGWYYVETDAGRTYIELCPITCAIPRDVLGRLPLQMSFGCPTLRADGLCMQ